MFLKRRENYLGLEEICATYSNAIDNEELDLIRTEQSRHKNFKKIFCMKIFFIKFTTLNAEMNTIPYFPLVW